jgi:DNA polymerase-3 subunit epsilon
LSARLAEALYSTSGRGRSILLGGIKRSVVLGGLLVSVVGLAWLAAIDLDWRDLGPRHYLLLVAAAVGAGALAMLGNAGWRVHARLERLRGHIALAATNTPLPPVRTDAPDSIDRLYIAVADLIGRRRAAQGALDRRLEQILSALPDAVLAVTEEGLVSLANAAGRSLFADGGSIVGTSVYDVLTAGGLEMAMTESRRRGLPVDCRLATAAGLTLQATVSAFADAGGAVLRFAADQPMQGPIEHDLALHDRPVTRVTAGTPLNVLCALVLDTETTGLDPLRDRLISLGAVRIAGARCLRHEVLDFLVNPGRQIPARSTAVHGISDLMVLPAPPFQDVAPTLMKALDGLAVIGHHTMFDLTILKRAAQAAAIDWQDPPWLDTALLYSALTPDAIAFDLDAVAEAVGVRPQGRHTALGDALTTAEVYLRLLPQLEARGITTLGQAMAFQMTGRKTAKSHPVEGVEAP